MKPFLIAATLLCASVASAQKAKDPSAQLREVLPAKVADHVLATIADARSHSLPAAALEQQALRLARNGTKPGDVEKSIDRSAENMKKAKGALQSAGRKPTNDEVIAGGALIGKGVDGAQVRDWARTAPSGRDLTVPINVTASLMNRGLKSDAALARVHDALMQKKTDRQLVAEANATADEHRPATANKVGGLANRPDNPGVASRPVAPPRPATPARKR
ncbi:MAG: hypothetical protein M3P00_13005 [Gemmatimonadota bacterium]|nr:hypothetical protein [Gemmatimonadota bacterium]